MILGGISNFKEVNLMKSLLKYAGVAAIVLTTLLLTACASSLSFDVEVPNSDEITLETDLFRLTNQDLFELVASGYTNGTNPGVAAILEWADNIILPELVEIDEDMVNAQIEFSNSLEDDELERMLVSQGFNDLNEFIVHFRIGLMREQLVRDTAAAAITEDELYDLYNIWFPESEDEDREDFDEVRDSIRDILVNEELNTPGFWDNTLALARAEAGLTIYSNYFATRYTNLINAENNEDLDIATSRSSTVIASIESNFFYLDDFVDTVLSRFALGSQSRLLDRINFQILNEMYDADEREVNNALNQARIDLLEAFHPQMQAWGLLTEQQIYDFFVLNHLQGLLLDEHLELDDERVEYLHANYPAERDTYHILVDDHDFAVSLIERLNNVSADELPELFSDLAKEYSTCGSAPDGGFLGRQSIPTQMVAEFEEAAFALSEGEFSSSPIETSFGYHIIFVNDLEPTPSLSVVREQELARMRTNARYFNNIMFGLREVHGITFHNESLQTQYNALREQNRLSLEN